MIYSETDIVNPIFFFTEFTPVLNVYDGETVDYTVNFGQLIAAQEDQSTYLPVSPFIPISGNVVISVSIVDANGEVVRYQNEHVVNLSSGILQHSQPLQIFIAASDIIGFSITPCEEEIGNVDYPIYVANNETGDGYMQNDGFTVSDIMP